MLRWFLAICPRTLRMFPPIGTSEYLLQLAVYAKERIRHAKIYLFVYSFLNLFGSAGSWHSVLGFSSCSQWGATLQLRCVGFPLPQPPRAVEHGILGHKTLGHGTLNTGLWSMGFWGMGLWSTGLWSTGSAIVAHGLSCPKTGIFLDHGLELVFTVLQGGFLITGLPGKPEIQRFTAKLNILTLLLSALFMIAINAHS